MTDQKLSQITGTTSLQSTDLVYVVANGQSRQITVKDLGRAMTGNIDVQRDFDAVGDGLTNNNQAFVDAEADRVALGYQKTHVPEGDFLVTTPPDWSKIDGPGFILYGGDTIPAGDIRSNVTVNVPAAFPTIDDAWDYLYDRTITGSAFATIQVADGTYNLASTLKPTHPQGARILFLGNQSTPANCVLNFTHGGADDGIRVDLGYVVGFMNGFTIQLPTKAAWPNGGSAVKTQHNGHVNSGTAMITDNFYYGGFASRNGSIKAKGWEVKHAGDVGLFGFLGGYIEAVNATVSDTIDSVRGLGTGILGEHNGTVDVQGATVTNSNLWDIAAVNNGHLRIEAGGVTQTGVEPILNFFNNQVVIYGGGTVEDIVLDAKGAGARIQIDSSFVGTVTAVKGYINGKDAGGVDRKLAVLED